MEINIRNVTKKYGDKIAVNNINIHLQEGIYGLLGSNGAGKSTLLRILCSVLHPTKGAVYFNGRNINLMGKEYRGLLGYLPQEFGCYPDFTAEELLLYVASLKGIPKRTAKLSITELLASVGLSGVANKKLKTFSGGMKQRLGIAQVLLNHPAVIILDEPTAGLDPKERIRFRELLKKYSENSIVILSTHIVSDLENTADNILLMKEGELLLSGDTLGITRHLDGKVWTCICAKYEIERYYKHFCVTNRRDTSSGVELRIIGDIKPCDEACRAEGTLEDLYMYYFRDGGEEDVAYNQI